MNDNIDLDERFIVINVKDLKYLHANDIQLLGVITRKIEDGRIASGLKLNKYITVNVDEPYAKQVWDLIMGRC